MKENITDRCNIMSLLKRIQEGYSPNGEELKIIVDLRNDIGCFCGKSIRVS